MIINFLEKEYSIDTEILKLERNEIKSLEDLETGEEKITNL
jgi:hypothetical protein